MQFEDDKTLKLEQHNTGMANHVQKYLKEASRVFLQGSGLKTPAEAVEAGIKSIVDWCECLNKTRREYDLTESNEAALQRSRSIELQGF
jgi:acetylornithine/succinyldiaminopimelate/putrescine aminotransferase